jgi:predicted ATPase
VFAGGFTLRAVAAVCLDGDEERALTLVERLVEGSLVVAEARQSEMRYRLLETVRQYAATTWTQREAGDETRVRHADYHLRPAGQQSLAHTRLSHQ